MRSIIHILAHFGVPALLAPGLSKWLKTEQKWTHIWLLMSATMAIDLDHLIATPIYDPNRCSVGFHPLHTSWAIGVYFILLFHRKTRILGIGLLVHIALDTLDCLMMKYQL